MVMSKLLGRTDVSILVRVLFRTLENVDKFIALKDVVLIMSAPCPNIAPSFDPEIAWKEIRDVLCKMYVFHDSFHMPYACR